MPGRKFILHSHPATTCTSGATSPSSLLSSLPSLLLLPSSLLLLQSSLLLQVVVECKTGGGDRESGCECARVAEWP